MTFAEKLKSIRKQAGMSQEQLAEKLGVSRQAVTKWETDAGIPDIENIMAISALFDISIDELLSSEKGAKKPTDYLYERKSVSVWHPIPYPRSRMISRSRLMTSEKGLMWM